LWGKAAFSAMAGAWLEINGSLKDEENAGFVIKAGFDAGWGAGAPQRAIKENQVRWFKGS